MFKTKKWFFKRLIIFAVIVYIVISWRKDLPNEIYIRNEFINNSVGNSLNKLNYSQESDNDSKVIKTFSPKNLQNNELIYQKIKKIFGGSKINITLKVKTFNIE